MPFDIVNWMGSLKDSQKLSELTIPGTHNAAARAQPGVGERLVTQTLDLQAQLNAGVRFLDIRARYIKNQFRLAHENTDLNLRFDEARDILMNFLAEHPRETIIMSLKEEGSATGNDPNVTFQDRFDQYVDESRALWFLRNEIPTLGQVRGKIVLFRRFPLDKTTTTARGINAYDGFPDNDTGTIEGPPKLRIQDEFGLLSTPISSKWRAIEFLLNEASAQGSDGDVLYVNFTSAAGIIPRDFPRSAASYINPRLRKFFEGKVGNRPIRFGIVPMDFADPDLVALIVRANLPVNIVPASVGYWIVDERASVAALASAVTYPASGGASAGAVAIAATPTGSGYWILAPDGKVYAHGRARNVGEGVPDGTKATSMAVHPAYDGFGRGGYWILADNGRVGAFGVQDHGGIEPTPDLRAVSIVATPDGGGYWILASDGSIHVFGNAAHFGDRRDAGQTAVAMATTRDGGGYWILSDNGAIHQFGNAVHYGQDERSGASAIAVTQDGGGYWVLYSNGDVRNFGSAFNLGRAGLGGPAVGIAVDNSYYFFRSKLNDFVVDVTDANPEAGTPLIAYPQKRRGAPGNIDNQLWMFVPPTPPAFGFDFIASKQTGLVIDIQGGDQAPKTPLVVDPRKTSEANVQLWSLSPSDSERSLRYVYIQNRLTREVIDINDEKREPKTPLIAFPLNGHSGTDNQLWLAVRFF